MPTCEGGVANEVDVSCEVGVVYEGVWFVVEELVCGCMCDEVR